MKNEIFHFSNVLEFEENCHFYQNSKFWKMKYKAFEFLKFENQTSRFPARFHISIQIWLNSWHTLRKWDVIWLYLIYCSSIATGNHLGTSIKLLMQQGIEERREGWASRHPPVRALLVLLRTNIIVLIEQIWLDLNISWLFW